MAFPRSTVSLMMCISIKDMAMATDMVTAMATVITPMATTKKCSYLGGKGL